MAFSLEDVLKGNGFEDCQGAVAAAAKKHREQATERLQEQLIGLIDVCETALGEGKVNLQRVRKQEKAAKADLQKVGDAVEYFKKSGNPLPFFRVTNDSYGAERFCTRIGVPVPEHDDKLWEVPPESE